MVSVCSVVVKSTLYPDEPKLSVPVNRITSILRGTRAITADTALRFSRFFGTSAEFWLNLQAIYDLKIAEKKHGKLIQKQVLPHSEAA